MLEVDAIASGYGRAQILFDVSLSAKPGEVIVLLGRNGAGKSTTLKTIIGMIRSTAGEIRLDGVRIDRLPSYRIARKGLGYVPEERRIFTDLSVAENLEVGRQAAREKRSPWTFERIAALFPNLLAMRDRPGGGMSGGEQQMLTIARTLMGNPSTLLLDEPSEGLAPIIVQEMARAIAELKREGLAIVLSEQNLAFAQALADRAYVIEQGHIRHHGSMAALMADRALFDRLFAL